MKKYTTVKTVMKTHKVKWAYKLVLALFILSLFQGWSFFHPTELDSATLTNAKDLIENSRLSFSSSLEGAHSVGATTITIAISGEADINNYHIFPGDPVTIGTGSYTVGTVIDDANDNKFTITTGLATGDNDDNDPVYVNQTALHTATFTTASAVANGAIRISVPANTNDTNNSDSKPDRDGFDFDSVSGVSCTPDTTTFDFVTGTATDGGTSGWHTFECRYSGNGSGSTALTMTIGSTNELINPAPESGHNQGTADDYTIRIQNRDSSYATVDSVDVKVVVVEAVRVTATVEETLSFAIAGRASGTTSCNQAADITTTVYSVPFGSLSTVNSFTNGAQQLTVSTNADDGYVVTVFEDDELGLDGANTPNIPDTPCNVACTHTTTAEWTTASYNGFGYSLEEVSGTNPAKFEWEDGTWLAKHFPNRSVDPGEDQNTNAEIMSYGGPVSGNSIYVCYRISISGIQEAGNYYNTITYIATPQF